MGLCTTEGYTEAGWEGQEKEAFVLGIKFMGAPEKAKNQQKRNAGASDS